MFLFTRSLESATWINPLEEWRGDNITSRTGSSALPNPWKDKVIETAGIHALPTPVFQFMDVFAGMQNNDTARVYSGSIMEQDYQMSVTLGNMFSGTGPGGTAPVSTSTNLSSFTLPLLPETTVSSGSGTMQSGSPLPSDITLMTRVSAHYDTGTVNGLNRTALKISFDESPTPVYAFGLFLADFESNTAAPARILVYDLLGELIYDSDLGYSGKLNGVANAYQWGITPQSDASAPHGNSTTTFLGILSNSNVALGHVILVGGDESISGPSYSAALSEGFGMGGFIMSNVNLVAVPEPRRSLLILAGLILAQNRICARRDKTRTSRI